MRLARTCGRRVLEGTETESDAEGGRDPLTQFHAEMPTEGPLTEAGLEVWPRGIYDLVMQISREYRPSGDRDQESGCGYLDAPDAGAKGRGAGC